MNNRTAIYIPTYNNRYSDMLNYANKLVENYAVFIIFSNNDEKLDTYKNYIWDERINLVYCDAKTLGEKRQFAIDYISKLGFKYVIQIEDDIKLYAREINESSKRETSESYRKVKISLEKMIDKMIETADKYNAAFVSPAFPFSLGFSKPGAVSINKGLNFGQFTMLNVEMVNKAGIKYNTEENVHDDVQIVIEMLQHGLTCVTLKDMAFEVIGSSSLSKNSTVCNGDRQDIMRMNLYIKYRDGIALRIGKRGELRMTCKLDKYWNTFEIPIKDDDYHKEVYRLCFEKDIKKLKELIISHSNKK